MPKMIDPFEIPDDIKPYRMTYQWVRQSTMGVRDTDHIRRSRIAGWRKIKRNRHKSLLASELWDDAPWIEYGGLALMERPTYLSIAARQEELYEARRLVNGWRESHRYDCERPWHSRLSASVGLRAFMFWEAIKWLPQIKIRLLMPRLTYSFKKQ